MFATLFLNCFFWLVSCRWWFSINTFFAAIYSVTKKKKNTIFGTTFFLKQHREWSIMLMMMIFDDHLVGGRPINVTELALIFLAKKCVWLVVWCMKHIGKFYLRKKAKKNFMQTGYVGWMFLLLFVIVFVAKIQETKKKWK